MKLLDDFVHSTWQTSINNRSKFLNWRILGKSKFGNWKPFPLWCQHGLVEILISFQAHIKTVPWTFTSKFTVRENLNMHILLLTKHFLNFQELTQSWAKGKASEVLALGAKFNGGAPQNSAIKVNSPLMQYLKKLKMNANNSELSIILKF